MITRFASHIAFRVVDWLPVISYALHNIFIAIAIQNGTSIPANYILTHYGLSPLYIITLLVLGLIWSACLWLHWKVRLLGMIPLVIVAITTLVVYALTEVPLRVIAISWVYFMVVIMPLSLVAVQGMLADTMREAQRLETVIREQNQKLIEYEARFELDKDGTN